MVKRLLFFTIALVFFQISEVYSQISIGTVDAGPYGYGSHITVPIIIPATAPCLPRTGNLFELYLSDETGNFANERLIGSYAGFYTNFVNGVIPTTPPLPPSNNYKLRVKITGNSTVIEYPGTITIRGVNMPNIGVTPSAPNQILGIDTYGFCGAGISEDKDIILVNNSASSVTTQLVVTNQVSNGTQTYSPGPVGFSVSDMTRAYYTAVLNGSQTIGGETIKSSKTYLLLNILSKASIQSPGDLFGCIDPSAGNVATKAYSIAINGSDGIQNNYPGSIYRISWGDGSNSDFYTHCELIARNGAISHDFTQTSCGQPPINLGNGDQVRDAFSISATTINPFCNADPNSAISYAKIFVKPIARIIPPLPVACINQPVTFNNGTIGGNNSDCSATMLYEWWVDGKLESVSETFTHIFTTNGDHVIKLVARNDVGICTASEDTFTICVQNPPQPGFTLPSNIVCLNSGTLTPVNTSLLDNACPAATPTYTWTVTGPAAVDYQNGTSASSPTPQLKFNQIGRYLISLTIQSATCEATTSIQEVIVDGEPNIQLSGPANICQTGPLTFSPNATITRTIITGSVDDPTPLPDTYTWEVTSTGNYNFVSPSTANSKYPIINFSDYGTYTVKLTIKNSCRTISETQIINIYESPIPRITANINPICYNESVTLTGNTGGSPSLPVTWDNGTNSSGFSSPNGLTTTYTPTADERAARTVKLFFRVNTGLDGACAQVTDSITIQIKPEVTISSPATVSICDETPLNYTITSDLANTTYTWTATGTPNAGGYSASGTTNLISDVLTNSDPLNNATVTYTITPTNDGCQGEPFVLTVTITPKPAITTPVVEKTICHDNPVAITINSNIPTRFTWTSVASAGITGNNPPPAQGTPSSSVIIPDRLRNNTFVQGTVTYTITPYSAENCPGEPLVVTVKVDPAVTRANAGPDDNICSTSTYQLKGNKPHVGSGFWRSISTHPVTPNIPQPTDSITNVNDLRPGQTYQFEWAITGPGVCEGTKDTVVIVVNEPTVGGTAATVTPLVCANNNTGAITLSGQVGLVTGWQRLTANDADWVTIPGDNTDPTFAFNNLTITTQFRAIVRNGGCDPEFSDPVTVNVTPATTPAKAGSDQELCAVTIAPGTIVKLDADPTLQNGEIGAWVVISNTPNAVVDNPNDPKSTISGIIPGQTYRFVWTITGTGACGPTTDTVTITNNPLINQNITSTSVVVCSGQEVTLSSGTPTTGGNRPYTYSWEIQVNDGQWIHPPTDANDENLVITLTTPDTVRFRRIVTGGACTDTSNVYPITVRPPITGNDITADQIICSGIRPATLTGQTLAGGGGSFTYQWQSSPDNTTWTNIIGINTVDYQPAALTTTTFYRRGVSTADCGSAFIYSNSVKITVNPNADAEFTWTHDIDCFPFSLPITAVEHADRNGIYIWYANNSEIGRGSTFPGYTIAASNQSVTIKLVVTSSFGCASDSLQHVFSTNQAVPASFTHSTSSNCGPVSANFVNTSIAGATFRWNFGNGQTSNDTNPPTVTFQPDASGKDTTYVVTLYSITSCGTDSAKVNILVKSPPRPVFSPSATNVCSPTPITFTNNSPLQAGVTYTFNFGDGTQETTNDRSSVTHIYPIRTTVQTYYATLTAVNECNTVTTTPYTIIVRPNTVNAELVVNDGNQLVGCAPHTVTFDNNTTGATSYIIDFNDGTQPRQSIISPERFQYTFTNPGTYKVLLTATNGCSTDTTSETIIVRPQPLADFDALNRLGCTGLAVKFTNNTQNGVSYVWDFGDGTTSTEFEPTHTYSGTQEYYTVTLTAINNLGCPMTVTKTNFIHIVQPPVAAFNVNPSTLISIPDYTFNFEDQSTNTPTIWEWDFGDGTSSALRNPSHTYLDTGTYRVTLKTTNQQGCFTTTFKDVTIKGVPGYLFVPNSFIPGDTRPELREFRAKGSGIATWRFSIFNKWGQLLWETTKLEEGRPAEGWDGTFKGQPMPQGVYFWKIDVQMVNGSEWKGMTYDKSVPKRTGPIHLIR